MSISWKNAVFFTSWKYTTTNKREKIGSITHKKSYTIPMKCDIKVLWVFISFIECRFCLRLLILYSNNILIISDTNKFYSHKIWCDVWLFEESMTDVWRDNFQFPHHTTTLIIACFIDIRTLLLCSALLFSYFISAHKCTLVVFVSNAKKIYKKYWDIQREI